MLSLSEHFDQRSDSSTHQGGSGFGQGCTRYRSVSVIVKVIVMTGNSFHNNGREHGRSSPFGGGLPSNAPRRSLDDMVNRIRFVRRSRENRVLGGVAGGLAETLEVDPTVVRIIIVVFALSTGIGFLAYLGAWLLLPKSERDHAPEAMEKPRKRTSGRTLGAIALVSIGAINIINTFGIHLNNDYLLPMTLIGLGSAVLFTNGRRPVSGSSFAGTAGPGSSADESTVANGYGPGFDAGPWPTGTTSPFSTGTSSESNMTPVDDAVLPYSAARDTSSGSVTPSATWPSLRTPVSQPSATTFPELRVAQPPKVDPEKAHALNLARQEIDALTAHEQYWPLSSGPIGTPDNGAPTVTQVAVAKARKSPYARKAFAVLLMIGGAMTLSAVQGWFDVSVGSLLASALILVGAGLLVGAWLGRPIGFIFVGLCLSFFLLSAAVLTDTWDKGIGQRAFLPTSASEVQPSYALAIGEIKLAIPKAALSKPTTNIAVKLGIGNMMVTVPDDAIVRLHAKAKAGEISMFGRKLDGTDLSEVATFTPKASTQQSPAGTTTPTGVPASVTPAAGDTKPRVIDLTTEIQLGQIQVLRETDAAALAAAEAVNASDNSFNNTDNNGENFGTDANITGPNNTTKASGAKNEKAPR